MLARNAHGRPPPPPAWGKEIMVFVRTPARTRLEQSFISPSAPNSAALTGNLNASTKVAFSPQKLEYCSAILRTDTLGLQATGNTPPQVEHYDNLAAHFDAMKAHQNILVDFAGISGPISPMDYFKQK